MVLSWLPFLHSNRCGSPSKNTTSLVHQLSTTSASKCSCTYHCGNLDHGFQFTVKGIARVKKIKRLIQFFLFYYICCSYFPLPLGPYSKLNSKRHHLLACCVYFIFPCRGLSRPLLLYFSFCLSFVNRTSSPLKYTSTTW